ncbi:MAG: PIN domain-containing protein [Pirellulales bacterium]
MILLDTSVLIDALQTQNAKMRQQFVDLEAAICGVTWAEVLHGATDERQFHRLANALAQFPQVAMPEGIWAASGRTLYILRTAGLVVPFADAILATVAMETGLTLWTRDTHFGRIQSALPRLTLLEEPGP